MTWQLSAPQSEAQWQAYYNLRYQVLRAPWGQAPGSERDELEAGSFHQMVTSADGEVLAVGRLHRLDDGRAQVRYMAVSPSSSRQRPRGNAVDGIGATSRSLGVISDSAKCSGKMLLVFTES